MKLDLSPLEDAVAQLEDGLVQYDSDIVRGVPADPEPDEGGGNSGVRVHVRAQR